jgi:protein-S-isoprenylcysteine O-methyltransferase Ste14
VTHLSLLATAAVVICWGAVLLTWLAGALYNAFKGPAVRTRAPFRSALLLGAVVVLVAAIVLVTVRLVPLAEWRPLVVRAPWARALGLAVLLGFTAFTLWARVALGTMWSMDSLLKQEHQLRTSGPYAITRHPIYSGILGMLIGTVLLVGIGREVLILPVGVVLLEVKIHMEERLLLAAFPDDCPRYRRRVPQLVPGLRLAGWRATADA